MNGPSGPNQVELRPVTERDLPILYEHQLDPEGNRMAAFTARDRDAFMTHWRKIMHDDTVIVRTVTIDGDVAGNVLSWEHDGTRLVGYWIDRASWGRGVATRALTLFLELVTVRPLHAYVAEHNVGSIRVLEKCGFTVAGQQSTDVDEVIMTLA